MTVKHSLPPNWFSFVLFSEDSRRDSQELHVTGRKDQSFTGVHSR